MLNEVDDPNTEGYILKLANVYRQTLKKDINVVSLQEELDLLQTYMFLMRYGREKAISFDVEVSDTSLNAQLPVFALQLLGDNCVKHNVFSESQPLHIRLFQKDPQSITMTNNYQRNEHLEMRYALEGIEDAVLIEKAETTYSTTLKLF
jgi:two-component system, LytTR family, sensor kinase